jgi:RHS repeat-associated protein
MNPISRNSISFRADKDGGEYWSGEANHCAVPGCEQAEVIVPGGGEVVSTTITYTYDPLNRLTAADYTLKGAGASGEYFHYIYDDANRMPVLKRSEGTSAGGVTYTWDDAGNLLNDGVNTYTYDHANKLTMVQGPSSIVSFTYNGLGDRLTETIDGATTVFLLDLNTGLTQVLAEGTHIYLYGVGRIAQVNPEGTEGPVYFLGDALGSVRLLTDGDGIVVLAQSYEPYGSVLNTAGEDVTTFGFTGEWQENGLVFLRSRYYGEDMGRFLNRDTWEGDANHPSSYNAYLYTSANPIRFTDPSGLKGEINCSTIPPWLWKDVKGCPRWEPHIPVTDSDIYDETIKPVDIHFWGMHVNYSSNLRHAKDWKKYDSQMEIYDPRDDSWSNWGPKLCGQISLAMILETITGEKFMLREIMDLVTPPQESGEGTDAYQLAYAAGAILPEGWNIVGHKGQWSYYKPSGVKWGAVTETTGYWMGDLSESSYARGIEFQLRSNRYTMLLVTINGNTGKLMPYWSNKSELEYSTGCGHWIVLTGMSVEWNWNDLSAYTNWIRIMIPFRNREEYWHWSDFYKARNDEIGMLEIYEKQERAW